LSDLPKPNSSSKLKRGAQPGNLNALKHGYYLSAAHLRGTAPLKVADLDGVSETIAYIRGFIHQTYESKLNTTSLAEVSEATNSLALAGLAIARLITLNNKLRSSARSTPDTHFK
jgi:hypothetical protein